jgi:hypothetical protein
MIWIKIIKDNKVQEIRPPEYDSVGIFSDSPMTVISNPTCRSAAIFEGVCAKCNSSIVGENYVDHDKRPFCLKCNSELPFLKKEVFWDKDENAHNIREYPLIGADNFLEIQERKEYERLKAKYGRW